MHTLAYRPCSFCLIVRFLFVKLFSLNSFFVMPPTLALQSVIICLRGYLILQQQHHSEILVTTSDVFHAQILSSDHIFLISSSTIFGYLDKSHNCFIKSSGLATGFKAVDVLPIGCWCALVLFEVLRVEKSPSICIFALKLFCL